MTPSEIKTIYHSLRKSKIYKGEVEADCPLDCPMPGYIAFISQPGALRLTRDICEALGVKDLIFLDILKDDVEVRRAGQ